ncbi:hypothetical protein [Flavobacterium psychrophilum]|uniref:DUF7793 family protein n=1 Tax=Flavobacterium psychrophilum TaxID=96345 RepID=UPI000909BA71|nr:hypothetical protein [Flavobacterium psychrophilum]EKT2072635.1 hypothetical protein [Flavobacterium psychrophilum]EKT4492148.1 hypothetical protein [Flavobacterium psychrophilum]SHH92655.1 Hypothetical protein THC0290_1138 [Flavobacterium psychrophilum]
MIAAHDLYENDFAQFWIVDGILFFKYKPATTIDLKVAQRVVTDRIHFQNERSYPVLCDIRGVVSTDKAGRDYLAKSGSILTQAVGLVVDEKVLLTISTFYLQINKPAVPTQIFTTEASALVYLKTYI